MTSFLHHSISNCLTKTSWVVIFSMRLMWQLIDICPIQSLLVKCLPQNTSRFSVLQSCWWGQSVICKHKQNLRTAMWWVKQNHWIMQFGIIETIKTCFPQFTGNYSDDNTALFWTHICKYELTEIFNKIICSKIRSWCFTLFGVHWSVAVALWLLWKTEDANFKCPTYHTQYIYGVVKIISMQDYLLC